MSADDQWVAVVADAVEAELRKRFPLLGWMDPVVLRESAEAAARRARRDLELIEGTAVGVREVVGPPCTCHDIDSGRCLLHA